MPVCACMRADNAAEQVAHLDSSLKADSLLRMLAALSTKWLPPREACCIAELYFPSAASMTTLVNSLQHPGAPSASIPKLWASEQYPQKLAQPGVTNVRHQPLWRQVLKHAVHICEAAEAGLRAGHVMLDRLIMGSHWMGESPPGRSRGRSEARRAVMEAVAFCFMLRSKVGGSCSTCAGQEASQAQAATPKMR